MLKKLALLSIWLALPLAAQTVNPNQIRPGTTAPTVLTTTTADQPPSWQPQAAGVGVAAATPCTVNGGAGPVTSGTATVFCPSSTFQYAYTQQGTGQYVLVPFTSSVCSATTGGSAGYINGSYGPPLVLSAGGFFITGGQNGSCTFSNPVLPSGVTTGQITAIYAVGWKAETNFNNANPTEVDPLGFSGTSISGGAVRRNGSGGGMGPTPLQYGLQLTGTFANFSSITATAAGATNFDQGGGSLSYTTALEVDYTGTPVVQSGNVNLGPGFGWDATTDTLSLVPFAIYPITVSAMKGLPEQPATTYNLVLDGATTTDCSTGGGTDTVWCVANGSGGFTGFPFGGSGINQLTGDGTAGPGSGSQALTLATVNSGPGTCGDSTHVCQITTNGKGLTTAQTQVAITGGGSGITSINGNTGAAQTFESLDSSVTITEPDNTHVNFQATGSGGGIVQPNPSNTTYAILTDSRGLSSTTSGIAIPAATAAVCGAGICTITAPNNFKAGDWVGFCCSGFSPSALVGNPYYAQVLAAGLSPTQFEIASTVTGTGTGGALVNASFNWPLAMANLPYFKGHGTVLDFNPTSGETLANLVTFYNANLHSISPGQTSNPGFLYILAGYNDLVINGGCSLAALPSMEVGYQELEALAHADGWQVVMVSNPANSHASDGGACNDNSFYGAFQQLNQWTKGQTFTGYKTATTGTASISTNSLTVADGTGTSLYQVVVGTGIPANAYITACSPTCGTSGAMTLTLSTNTTAALSTTAVYLRNQWWDYLVDAASEINAPFDIGQGVLFTQSSNPPHFSDQGNMLIAQLANATMIQGASLQLKTQCGNGDGCPNMTQTNWWIPQGTTSGMEQQIQTPNTGTQDAAWESYAGAYGCIGFGYNSNFSVGDGSIYYSPGNICGGANNYPYLNFRQVSGGGSVYEPANILFGWSSADGQGAPDTGLSRDSAAVVDVGNGAVGNKTGAMQMASLFLGIASDPGSPSNGQLWYNSTSNLLKAYINGATVTLGGGGGGGGLNGTVTYTSSQTAASGDNGKLVIMNCSSACAYTLPATQPSTTWQIALQSVGSTTATVGLSGDTYNGGASAPVLPNYYTLPIWANSTTSTDYRGGTPPVQGTNMTITPAANGQTYAASVTGSSPLTTKGDLYGFDTANARIPVGSNGQVLTADSTQTLGVKWAAGGGGGGGMTNLCSTVTLTSGATCSGGVITVASGTASVTMSSISGGTTLLLRCVCQTTSGSLQGLEMQFNGDTGSNYNWQQVYFYGSTSGAGNGTSATALQIGAVQNNFGVSPLTATIPIYSNATPHGFTSISYYGNGSVTNTNGAFYAGNWTPGSPAAITSITLFIQGSSNFGTSYITLEAEP